MPELQGKLLEALNAGSTVVAPTDRHAREIARNFALCQADRGAAVWDTANILSWQQWLRSLGEQVLWSGYSSPQGRRQLLTPLQARVLWQRIISASPTAPVNVNSTVSLVQEAWTMLQQWRLPDPGAEGFANAEQQAFSGWMKHYHRECVSNSWLDGAKVTDSLIPAINSGAVAVPGVVVLVGFDSFNPQQRALLRSVANMGSRLAMIRPVDQNRNSARLVAADRASELRLAIRWLRAQVSANSMTRAGLVVPGLEDNYHDIERLLDEAMLPGHSIPGTDREVERPYMIGAGRPLRKQPVVIAADHILALSMGSVSMRVLTRIVGSPFLAGGISEAAWRARFDEWIRRRGTVDIDVEHLPGMLESFRHSTGLASEDFVFERQIADMLEQRAGRSARPPSQWSDYFRRLLSIFGWPGESRLDAIQRQARVELEEMLREFASLDIITGELEPAPALRIFRQLLRQRQFLFEAQNVPIMVLEPADAASMNFDQLWLLNADARDWPGEILRSNPLVPLEWLQQCGIPTATVETRAQYRSTLAAKLCASASDVIVSHTKAGQHELLQFFEDIEVVPESSIELAELTDYRQALAASTEMETLNDRLGPPLEPVELLDLDQDVLALQAACPFRAFATQRLETTAPKPLRPGLLPEARTALLRMALEHVWHRIESLDVLQAALQGEHLEVQIWEIADTVLAVFERKIPVRLSRRYRALEHARLVRLLMQWLQVETNRSAFQVIQTDAHAKIQLAGVALRAHVNRIDQIDENGMAIIAYDTEPFVAAHWLGNRPDKPGLMLYALATDEPPVALLTACVSLQRVGLGGVQHQPGVVSDMPVYEDSELAKLSGLSWEGLLDNWKEVLTEISVEFAAGEASVAPKYGKHTCASCDLASLCRVGEQLRA